MKTFQMPTTSAEEILLTAQTGSQSHAFGQPPEGPMEDCYVRDFGSLPWSTELALGLLEHRSHNDFYPPTFTAAVFQELTCGLFLSKEQLMSKSTSFFFGEWKAKKQPI